MSGTNLDTPEVLKPNKETSKSDAKETLIRDVSSGCKAADIVSAESKCNIPVKRKLSVEAYENSPPRKRSAMLTTAWEVEIGNIKDATPLSSSISPVASKPSLTERDTICITTITKTTIDSNSDSLDSTTTNTSVVDKATTTTVALPSQLLVAVTSQPVQTSDLANATVAAATALPSPLLSTVASPSLHDCNSDSLDSMTTNTSVADKSTLTTTDLPSVLLATETSQLGSLEDSDSISTVLMPNTGSNTMELLTPTPISAEETDINNAVVAKSVLPSPILATVAPQSMQNSNSDSLNSMETKTSAATKATTDLPTVLLATSQLSSLEDSDPVATSITSNTGSNSAGVNESDHAEVKSAISEKISSTRTQVSPSTKSSITPVESEIKHTAKASLSENDSLSNLTSDVKAAEDSDTLANCTASETATQLNILPAIPSVSCTASSKIPITATDIKISKLPTTILTVSSATNSMEMNKQLSVTTNSCTSEKPSQAKPSLSSQGSGTVESTNSMAAQPKSQSFIKRNHDGNKSVISSIFIPRNYSSSKSVDDKPKITNTSADPIEHIYKMNPSNLATVPILSPSYLKSLSLYIMTAKNFTTLSDEKSKEPLVAEKAVKSLIKRVEDIQQGIIDPNEAATRDAYTQAEESFVALQRKMSLLRSNIKKKSAEITSLRGAARLLTPTNVVADKLKGITKTN